MWAGKRGRGTCENSAMEIDTYQVGLASEGVGDDKGFFLFELCVRINWRKEGCLHGCIFPDVECLPR